MSLWLMIFGGALTLIWGAAHIFPTRSVVAGFGGRRLGNVMMKPKLNDLKYLKELLETGKVVPVIDRSYSLDKVPDAIRYLEEGHARGKVVVTV